LPKALSNSNPALAATYSLGKHLWTSGNTDLGTSIAVAKKFCEGYQAMLDAGIDISGLLE
jgi:hypothetical protein